LKKEKKRGRKKKRPRAIPSMNLKTRRTINEGEKAERKPKIEENNTVPTKLILLPKRSAIHPQRIPPISSPKKVTEGK